MSIPLSIEYGPSYPDLLVFKNENFNLVNSLPFIEEQINTKKDELGKSEKERIQELIKKEMDTMDKKDYLQDFPLPKTEFLDSDKMKMEFERVISKQIQPERKEKQLEIQLEYANIKRLNLELMEEYGLDEWDQQPNEDFIHGLKFQKEALDKKINEINKNRKFAQTMASQEIYKDYVKTRELIEKNIILEQEIIKLRESEAGIVSNKRVKTE